MTGESGCWKTRSPSQPSLYWWDFTGASCSLASYTLIFLFMCLHQVGAHYTYSEVPYDRWCEALTGRTFSSIVGWERNNFDRVVHFAYGLLLAHPVREIFPQVADVRGFWGYFLPLDLTMSTSMIYELLEWATAAAFGGDLGQAYLGTQGDEWDAHKDMALASLGALIAMALPRGSAGGSSAISRANGRRACGKAQSAAGRKRTRLHDGKAKVSP